MVDDRVLNEQIEYYRARAGEYDEWFYREGRYNRGVAENRAWFDELRIVTEELGNFATHGDVLELACGTGIWTHLLAARATSLTAVDASSEVMRINRAKLAERSRAGDDVSSRVAYVEADLFEWAPDRKYDVVFFAFWLSHVPPEKFSSFWDLVDSALKPAGRFFFIDSLPDPSSGAIDHEPRKPEDVLQRRRLNDGREFEIVKVYYDPDKLQSALRQRGFSAMVKRSGRFFIYGYGGRSPRT